MSISNLINGETIEIDNHNRGQIFTTKGLHLHKRMNQSKYNFADVLVSLERVEKIQYRHCNDKQSERILNEIKKSFKDKITRKRFIDSFRCCLEKMLKADTTKSEEEKLDFIKEAVEIIAEQFSKGKVFSIKPIDISCRSYIADYITENKETIYIKTDLEKELVTIGKERGIVSDIDL